MRVAFLPRALFAGWLLASLVGACGEDSGDNSSDDLTDAASDGPALLDAALPPVLTFDPAMVQPVDASAVPDAAAAPQSDAALTDAGRTDGGFSGDASTAKFICAGLSTSCSSLTTTTCTSAQGCRIEEDCTGLSRSCYSQYSSYSCNRVEGCYWSTYDDDCSGSAWGCSLMSTQLSCIDQGCSWERSCAGVSAACFTFTSEVLCSAQPGCAWEAL